MDITVTSQGGGEYQEPQSPVEIELANVWQEVLGRKEIGINENFFSIGGDSIKAIQIVSRMNKAGYKLKMSDLFRHPVISLLAPLVTASAQKQDTGSISGPLPLLPSQEEFFKKITIDNHHYNHAVIIETEERLDRQTLETIFKKIQAHHDALRTVFREEEGIVTAEILDERMPLHIEEIDLTAEDDVDGAITKRANALQASINLNHGPLLKLGLFQLAKGSRLLIVVHHLVMDGVSWRILFEDIGELFTRLKQGKPLQMPAKSSSVKDWAQRLARFSNEPRLQEESQYWNELLNANHAPLPTNGEQSENTVQFQTVKGVSLDSQMTGNLLTSVHDAFGTEINDLLLAAFGLAVKEHWGLPGLLVALEGHGREDLFDDIEVQRTVGWFTSVFPVVVEAAEAKTLDRHIIDTKERLHRIPRKGIGYGILKYLSSNGSAALTDGVEPNVSFNYLGQFDMDTEDLPFRVIADSTAGRSHSPNQQREYQLDIECAVTGGKLNISASFSHKLFEDSDIESLLKEYERQLERIIDFCLSRGEREMTPTDFSYKDLSMDDLEQIGALVGE
jgi:non-ribosomal peptide synthase protein (TIGR01720 family)